METSREEATKSWSDFVRNRVQQCGDLDATTSWDDFVKTHHGYNAATAKSWDEFIRSHQERMAAAHGDSCDDDDDVRPIEMPLDVYIDELKKQKTKNPIRWLQKLSKINCLAERDETPASAKGEEENIQVDKSSMMASTESDQTTMTAVESEGRSAANNKAPEASLLTRDPLDSYFEEFEEKRSKNCAEWVRSISKAKCRSAPDDEPTASEVNKSASSLQPTEDNNCEVTVIDQTIETTIAGNCNETVVAEEFDVPNHIFMPNDVPNFQRMRSTERRNSIPDEMEKKLYEIIERAFLDVHLSEGSFIVDEDSYFTTSPPPSFHVSRTFSYGGAHPIPDGGTKDELPIAILNSTDATSLSTSANSQEVKCVRINEEDSFGVAPSYSPVAALENGHEVPIEETLQELNSPMKSNLGRPAMLGRALSSRLRRPTKPRPTRPAFGLTRMSSTLKHHAVIVGNNNMLIGDDHHSLSMPEEITIEEAPSPFFD